jgi:hypothetical protein
MDADQQLAVLGLGIGMLGDLYPAVANRGGTHDPESTLGPMPKREPAARPSAGAPPGNVVKMRLDAQGRWVSAEPRPETVETIEAAERPPTPDDPRGSAFRQIPPIGGVV